MARSRPDGTAEVEAFLAGLDHPFATEVRALRDIVKGVDPGIAEEIKWKAPSWGGEGSPLTE